MAPKSRPTLKVVKREDLSLPLSVNERSVVEEMLTAWRHRRMGTQRCTEKYHHKERAYVLHFLRFCGKPPWRWTPHDFDRWCTDMGVTRRLAVSTQRSAQLSIRTFLKYLIENVGFRTVVQEQFGAHLVQVCTEENCIPHLYERELAKPRPDLDHAQINLLFDTLEKETLLALNHGAKDLRPLQRDKALFYTMYVAALRISEALNLNTNSFLTNDSIPQFGQFGRIQVFGKGSRGNGPKFRNVVVDHPGLPPILTWYIEKIRPYFLRNADANEDALFLSERGQRLRISTAEARFQKLINCAGLDGRGFTPHSLRHSSISHGTILMSSNVMQRKAGHAYLSTTMGYTHLPDSYMTEQFMSSVKNQLDDVGNDEDLEPGVKDG